MDFGACGKMVDSSETGTISLQSRSEMFQTL